jgi:hypothetical protein
MQGKCCQREADSNGKKCVKDVLFHDDSFNGAEAPVDLCAWGVLKHDVFGFNAFFEFF